MVARLWLAFLFAQQVAVPAYVREGDQVEQQLRRYRDELEAFQAELRLVLGREAPELLAELVDRPPAPAIYGYQMLPTIVEDPPKTESPVSTFAYSWPITQEYIEGETIKLTRAHEALEVVDRALVPERRQALSELVREYRSLVNNHRTIDAYLQYNRFWQRSIATDRDRFDRLNRIYESIRSARPDALATANETLGKPEAPKFLQIRRLGTDRVTLRVPMYTDIEDAAFIEEVKDTIERYWQAQDAGVAYSVELDIRQVKDPGARAGDHIDLTEHARRFPTDGGVLTTGAPTIVAGRGRYIAFGPGEIARRTIAHEFGHILGFPDGYVRGYRDLGELGFEILELTSAFDDIMSAPRQGSVHAIHFKLILDALK